MPRRPARLVVSTAVAAAALAGLSACNPMAPTVPTPSNPAPAKPSAPATTNPATAYEARILGLVNAERAKKGLRPLAVLACADSYANSWASTMARTGSFQHQSLTPILKACAARGAGENIAFGNISADQMMSNWMNSPGHRANILNAKFTHIGIGAVKTSSGRWYGVQVFVTR